DMVSNTMSTFTSLTVHCSRCHDHKFDPIRQADYYALQAVFAGVDRADRSLDSNPQVAARRQQLAADKVRLAAQLALVRQRVGQAPESDAQRSELADAERAVKEVEQEIATLPLAPLVFAAASRFAPQGSFTEASTPRPIHVLARGDVRSPLAVAA